jgi:type IV pilus assembly protein PilC
MVKAGEASGSLDTVLERLANSMENAEAIRGKVKNAMVYPIVVLVIAFSILFLLLAFVIPQFVKMFNDSGMQLPLITRIVIGVSDWTVANWWLIIMSVIGGVYGFKKYRDTEKGKRKLDAVALKVPLFGNLTRKASVAKFTRTMSTLLESGVPILTSFDIVGEVVGNDIVKDAVLGAKDSIKEGNTIARPLHQSGQFPLMVTNMIEIGEESGTLVEMLEKVAAYNEREVDEEISNLLAAMEPLTILIMAIMVGTVVIALFLPMFSLSDVVVD